MDSIYSINKLNIRSNQQRSRTPIQDRQRESPQKQSRAYGVMPSYQKYEDHREEIKQLEELLVDLTQDKRHVNNNFLTEKISLKMSCLDYHHQVET